jgi:hypothetical protein
MLTMLAMLSALCGLPMALDSHHAGNLPPSIDWDGTMSAQSMVTTRRAASGLHQQRHGTAVANVDCQVQLKPSPSKLLSSQASFSSIPSEASPILPDPSHVFTNRACHAVFPMKYIRPPWTLAAIRQSYIQSYKPTYISLSSSSLPKERKKREASNHYRLFWLG